MEQFSWSPRSLQVRIHGRELKSVSPHLKESLPPSLIPLASPVLSVTLENNGIEVPLVGTVEICLNSSLPGVRIQLKDYSCSRIDIPAEKEPMSRILGHEGFLAV